MIDNPDNLQNNIQTQQQNFCCGCQCQTKSTYFRSSIDQSNQQQQFIIINQVPFQRQVLNQGNNSFILYQQQNYGTYLNNNEISQKQESSKLISSKQQRHLVCGMRYKENFQTNSEGQQNHKTIIEPSHDKTQNNSNKSKEISLSLKSSQENSSHVQFQMVGTKIRLDNLNQKQYETEEENQRLDKSIKMIYFANQPQQKKGLCSIDVGHLNSEDDQSNKMLLDPIDNDIKKEDNSSHSDVDELINVNEIISKEKLSEKSQEEKLNQIWQKQKKLLKTGGKANKTLKSKFQVQILNKEYQKNQVWSQIFIDEISNKIGLRRQQVYKWYWHRRDEYLRQLNYRRERLEIIYKRIFKVVKVEKNQQNKRISIETPVHEKAEKLDIWQVQKNK
ncbi:UNKNOWN [Stylonychia lemnae]|uniref:Homeobox domain-containing protein n=1 Tax=Stylonychia lemnae TaxID=5949 RepID=A0A078B8M8_STYLE|nr:UNKNOWN [Stylonychia lemnae]|eukprot:CDW90769.1 UNKNOWN [Stylonychia lemnae]